VRRILDFWRDQGGNAAIIFGLAVIPLIALAGGAVDLAHRAKVRTDLQAAADAAAIAAARMLQSGRMERDVDMDQLSLDAKQRADILLNTALADLGEGDIDITLTDNTITISTLFDVKTSFLGVIGINSLRATSLSEVALPDPLQVEVAMVLDYSGSMRDSDKYIRMTAAARDFIERVERDRGNFSTIGIVPFSEYVYADVEGGDIGDADRDESRWGGRGEDDDDRDWDDDDSWQGDASWSGDDDNDSGAVVTMPACLLNRDYPYSVTDEPAGIDPGSRWPQASSSRCQRYVDGNLKARDLTNDFAGLSEALADMEPVGLTNIALGLELGWHMLSPGPLFAAARDYSDPRVLKMLILLTDGMQTVEAMGPDGDISTEAADQVTAETCENAAAAGVRIFSIAYDIDDPAVRDLLLNCASSSTAYYDARSVSDISGVFDDIYSQIEESVWLSR
jgi:Flp pilus assembly protein TadG